ncbi:MAG: AMP-binding protein [Actinomycetota bacterium]|nr:AMP-binding protein [Actinomycetota bacterium]
MTLLAEYGTPGTDARSDTNVIWEAFERARGDRRPHLLCWEDGAYRPVTWDEWRRAAERVAVGLRELGVGPGTRVAAVLTNTFDACAAIIGTWLAGGVLLSFPMMRRGMTPPEYIGQLRRLCAQAGTHSLLLEQRFVELLGNEDLGAPVRGLESLGADGRLEPTPPADDEPAFVQYSSGSTSDPKGCMLSMGAISEQERMIADRLEVDRADQGVSWLPLSHDMGLFGCVLLSWSTGMPLALSTPERFLRKPQTWMDDCADLGATMTGSPNFGLALAARWARRQPPRGRFPMRSVVLGSERIEQRTLDEAHEVLGPYGMTRETLTPAYGLAEATLGVTMKRLGEAPRTVTIDSESAYRGELRLRGPSESGGRPIVSCGPPMPGVSVRTSGPDEVGRICVNSPSLADGYLENPAATDERFVDGELVTEDLGFVRAGELYVLGRTDDVIPLGGRNIHARDVELEVEQCTGVRPGSSVLIDVPAGNGSRLVLVAEPASGASDHLGALAEQMSASAFRAAGARVAECVFIQPGRLPKTPSGKVQRFRTRTLVTDDDPAVLERLAL